MLAAVLTLAVASAALAAPGTQLGQEAHQLTVEAQQLDSQTHQALLGVYALDSRLHASRDRLASLETAAAALRRRRHILRQQLGAAETSLKTAQHGLALHLRTLYEQGSVDPLAVVLGASSLGTALTRLDDLRRVANEGRQVVAATTSARRRLVHTRGRLAADGRRLANSLANARAAQQTLTQAVAARLAFISSLRAQERLREAQVSAVVAQAQAAQQRSEQLQASTPAPSTQAASTPSPPPAQSSPPPAQSSPPPAQSAPPPAQSAPPPAPSPPPTQSAPAPAQPAAGSRTMVVTATCYDLPGRTATGMPVGWGVIAVDPSVIPLGTRLNVPGYGDGVAADIGGGIQGARIDVWMPRAQCLAWGVRTVTVTID